MIPAMGLFLGSASGLTSVFLMVNCTRLLSLTEYNPSGMYGTGAKLEVINTVVPGFSSMGESVMICAWKVI